MSVRDLQGNDEAIQVTPSSTWIVTATNPA